MKYFNFSGLNTSIHPWTVHLTSVTETQNGHFVSCWLLVASTDAAGMTSLKSAWCQAGAAAAADAATSATSATAATRLRLTQRLLGDTVWRGAHWSLQDARHCWAPRGWAQGALLLASYSQSSKDVLEYSCYRRLTIAEPAFTSFSIAVTRLWTVCRYYSVIV